MRRVLAAAALLAAATLPAQASARSQGRVCVAKVIYSDELPFAPINFWLVRVALEIVPPDGNPYEIELQNNMPYNMPWQGPPPRRGRTFRLPCDSADRGDLHLILGRCANDLSSGPCIIVDTAKPFDRVGSLTVAKAKDIICLSF
jgi:hypothetical protein